MKINRFIFTIIFTELLLIVTLGGITHAQEWMPDAILRQAISEKLGIETLTIADMQRLDHFVADGKFKADLKEIQSLKGLEHAINLKFLVINFTKVSDITPLAGLENLRGLGLGYNRITDIRPLAGLIHLQELNLQHNQISDTSPLKGLVNLKVLDLAGNQIVDFTPIYGLTGIETLRLGLARSGTSLDSEILQRLNPVDGPVVCEIARAPIHSRLENITYPSVFQACGDIINMPSLSRDEGIAYHDLFFCGETFGWIWTPTPDGRRLIGDPEVGRVGSDRIRAWNPNILLLTGIDYYVAGLDEFPDDWPYFLRDAAGNRSVIPQWDQYHIDFTHPVVQEMIIQQAIEVAKCGIFDGIAIDHWAKALEGYITVEEADTAKDRIIQGIRDAVGEDFLILVTTTNTIGTTIPRHAEYINGVFMETTEDYEGGYTYARLSEIESTLLWAEENLREPQINCLAGRGVRSELLDSPRNLQWMRLWTTMSLTHSDGYVMFTMGGGLDHPPHVFEFLPGHADDHAQGIRHTHQNKKYWYDFYDADLGRPVGGDETKGQLYENREGLFIREFTNGWAVYNRSGTAQEIVLPQEVSGWNSGVERQRRHTLADLDGEIYLKAETPPTVDV
ncbi:MAG: leucine-rich repeat domain-containing protein, partial [Candidatus Poribacteria bacterium]|nr:leucine-rich repeat domain-containing protein [Candidatus Poribacteria bacterium]